MILEPRTRRTVLAVSAAISVALYALACAGPVFHFVRQPPVVGAMVLAWGWWGFLLGHFGWLANWLALAAFASDAFQRPAIALGLGALASMVALDALFVTEWWHNEGSATPVNGFGWGLFVWILAIAAPLPARVAVLLAAHAPLPR